MKPSGILCRAIAVEVWRPMERKAFVGTWWWCCWEGVGSWVWLWDWAVDAEGEGEEERECLWREEWSVRCPFVDAWEVIELSIVAGPDCVGCRGAVSSTSWRRGWRSLGPVVCARLAPEGREEDRWLVDFVVWSFVGRDGVRTFLKHSVPQVSEYPKH